MQCSKCSILPFLSKFSFSVKTYDSFDLDIVVNWSVFEKETEW